MKLYFAIQQEPLFSTAMPPSHIPLTFDKSHIVTIGERLYGESQ